MESLIGDSNTLIEELKDVEPEDKDAAAGTNICAAGGKVKGKRDNTKSKSKGGESLADSVAEEAGVDGGGAEVEGEGGDGAAGKSKKKKSKKKGGAGGVKGKGAGGEKVRVESNPIQLVLLPHEQVHEKYINRGTCRVLCPQVITAVVLPT